MHRTFKHIALIGKYRDPDTRELILQLAEFLENNAVRVSVESETAERCKLSNSNLLAMKEIGNQADLAVVLGGDGTMLSAARLLAESGIPLIGVNKGRLGFLTDLTADSMLTVMKAILNGEYVSETRMLLSGCIIRSALAQDAKLAFNDIVVGKTNTGRLIELDVHIDGQFVNRQRSDGLILATPTGTTAYSLSAGGPILHPALDAISLVPICPHTLSNRPFAISASSVVEITMVSQDEGAVYFDGQLHGMLEAGDQVKISRAAHHVTLLHPMGHSHFSTLRNKLNWG